jgi:phosphatidylinositol alpha-1,6-mannosyltransferase
MAATVALFSSEFPPYPGGIGTYCFEIADTAQALGLEPIVFAPQTNESERVPTNFEVNYILPSFYRHSNLPKVMSIVSRQLHRHRFDFVVSVDLNHLLPVAFARTDSKKIAIIHGTDSYSRYIRMINTFTPVRPYKSFDWIVSNSEFTKGLLLRHNRYVLASDVMVAPLGVSRFWHAPVGYEDVQRLTRRFDLDPQRFVFLSVGRLEPRKGVDRAIGALGRLPEHLRDRFTYLILGRKIDRDYTKVIEGDIHRAGLDIRLIGNTSKEELRALYHRSNILLHTATVQQFAAEGFGLVLLEAAACGLPVLATRVDAIPEVVCNNVTGYLVEDGDISTLAAKIENILSFPAQLEAVTKAAKAHSLRFNWESCARLTFKL